MEKRNYGCLGITWQPRAFRVQASGIALSFRGHVQFLYPSGRLAHGHFRRTVSVYRGWRSGVVASVVRRMNEVTLRRARLVLGWVTVFGRVYHQPANQVNSALHPSGVAKSSTSLGWVKGWNVTSAGWQVTLFSGPCLVSLPLREASSWRFQAYSICLSRKDNTQPLLSLFFFIVMLPFVMNKDEYIVI